MIFIKVISQKVIKIEAGKPWKTVTIKYTERLLNRERMMEGLYRSEMLGLPPLRSINILNFLEELKVSLLTRFLVDWTELWVFKRCKVLIFHVNFRTKWLDFWNPRFHKTKQRKHHHKAPLYLIALAIIFEAPRPFAVTTFAVSPVRLAFLSLSYFRFKGFRISVQAGLTR